GADNVEIINNREVKFTKGQTEKVLSLLDMLDIEVVERESEENILTKKSKTTKQKDIIICPNCSSANIEFIENNRKKFSVGKAIGGAALTGGIGTLAGFTGKKGNKDLWHCK